MSIQGQTLGEPPYVMTWAGSLYSKGSGVILKGFVKYQQIYEGECQVHSIP